MEELNKGYEFTRAQIAELESLRAENERLKQIKSRNKSIDLLAENQSLKTELEAIKKSLPDGYTESKDWAFDSSPVLRIEWLKKRHADLKHEIDELTSSLEAARKDAERYRWLRAEHTIIYPVAAVVWKRNYDRKESEWVNTSDVNSLDSAIDAAIEQAKGGV